MEITSLIMENQGEIMGMCFRISVGTLISPEVRTEMFEVWLKNGICDHLVGMHNVFVLVSPLLVL